MTCFWNGILSSLINDDFNKIGVDTKPNIKLFIELLKQKNAPTDNILWQNYKLTPKQIEENMEHIKSFDINTINSGYFCSTCDPFLLLIASVFKVNIEHKYNNIKIGETLFAIGHPKGLLWSFNSGMVSQIRPK